MEKTLIHKQYRELTDIERKYLYNSRKEGIFAKDIAEEMNVPESTVAYWRRRIADEIEGRAKPIKRKVIPRYERETKRSIIPFILNENKPTKLTETLICNYYIEDIERYKMTHDEAIRDISLELGRTEEYILSILKENRLGMKMDELH